MAGYLDARPRVGYFYTGKSSTQLLSDSIKNDRKRIDGDTSRNRRKYFCI